MNQQNNNTTVFNVVPRFTDFQTAMGYITENYKTGELWGEKGQLAAGIAAEISDMCLLFSALTVLDQPDNASEHDAKYAYRIFDYLEYSLTNPEPPYIRQIDNIINLVTEHVTKTR